MALPLVYVLHSGQMFGTERMALATIAALRDRFDGVIVAPSGPVHAAARQAGVASRVADGRLATVWALAALLLRQRHSVVFTTGVWQSLVALLLQRLCGGRGAQVHVVHGGTDERLSYGRKRWLAGSRVRLVAVSDFVRERLLVHGVPAAQITVIPNFLPGPVAAQRPPFDADGVRHVVMLSRLDRIKRVGLLFDALDRNPALAALRFEVYGSGEEAGALQQRARQHPNVVLHGFVPDATAALGRADLLLHTCPEEPFGLVVLEAFAAGVPVLVPNSGGAAGIVQDGVSGWHFSANDPVALGHVLQRLATAPRAALRAVVDGGRRALATDYASAPLGARYAALAGAAA